MTLAALTALHLKYDGDIPDEVRDAVKAGGADRLELMRARGALNYWTRELGRWIEIKERSVSELARDAADREIQYARDRIPEARNRLVLAEAAMQPKPQAAE